MKFVDRLVNAAYAERQEEARKKKIQFDKKLYNSDIIQQLLARVTYLEDKLREVEDEKRK